MSLVIPILILSAVLRNFSSTVLQRNNPNKVVNRLSLMILLIVSNMHECNGPMGYFVFKLRLLLFQWLPPFVVNQNLFLFHNMT